MPLLQITPVKLGSPKELNKALSLSVVRCRVLTKAPLTVSTVAAGLPHLRTLTIQVPSVDFYGNGALICPAVFTLTHNLKTHKVNLKTIVQA